MSSACRDIFAARRDLGPARLDHMWPHRDGGRTPARCRSTPSGAGPGRGRGRLGIRARGPLWSRAKLRDRLSPAAGSGAAGRRPRGPPPHRSSGAAGVESRYRPSAIRSGPKPPPGAQNDALGGPQSARGRRRLRAPAAGSCPEQAGPGRRHGIPARPGAVGRARATAGRSHAVELLAVSIAIL